MPDGNQLTPTTPLHDGETVLHSFRPDRQTYVRDHTWMAALAMAGGMGILYLMGNPHVWTGAVGGLAAIAIRAYYVASDELAVRWDLTGERLLGPQGRNVRLGEINALRSLGSAVQVITSTGDKHLLKYLADKADTLARLRAAMNRAGG